MDVAPISEELPSVALFGSPSESGGWPRPTSHSVSTIHHREKGKRAAVLTGNAPVVVAR